jgi:O-antigen/teichoic acid export membrane protein
MWFFPFSKARQAESMKPTSAQYTKINRLSGYLKALGSNYGLFVVNVSSYAIAVPLLLKWLGSERYGFWLIFLQLVYLVSLATTWIAAPIVREAATCYVEADGRHTQRLFQTVSIYYLVLGTATVTLAMLGSQFVPELFKIPPEMQTEVKRAFVLLSAYIAGTMQLNLLVSLLIGFQQMHIANLLLGALTMLATGLGIGAVTGGWGLPGLAAGQVAAVIIIDCVSWLVTYRIGKVTFGLRHFDCGLLLSLLRSGIAYVGYSISYLMLQSDILLVGLVIGSTAAAIYGVAYKVMDYAVQLMWKIPDSLLPTIAELDASRNEGSLFRVHRLCGTAAMAAALLGAIMIALYGHAGVELWVGVDNAAPPGVFLAFGVVIVLQVFVHSSLMISYGTNRMSAITLMALIEGGLKVAIAMLLLPRLGMIGAAYGSIFAQICITAWYVPLKACRLTGDSILSYMLQALTPCFPAALSTFILAASTLPLIREAWPRLLISMPSSVIIYFLICIGLGLGFEERRRMIGGMRRLLRIREVG